MKQNRPTVSVIISTYNRPDALEVSLLSIAYQTVLPDEIIIADDGSGESTIHLINEMKRTMPYPIVHVWHEDDGFRLAEIRNKAIVKASSQYIIQIDGDIVLEKHFIQDHLSMALKGCFVTGSRVNTSLEFAETILKKKMISIPVYNTGLVNKLNGLRLPFLSRYYRFRYKKNNIYYVKGCNMAFWKEDLIAVNGYNEDMIGWGKEDSEIAARLISLGRRKQFIKFGAVGYHIFHPFNRAEREIINNNILNDTINSGIIYAKNGLDKYLNDKKQVL